MFIQPTHVIRKTKVGVFCAECNLFLFTSYHNDKCSKKIYYYDELSSQGYSLLLFCEGQKKFDILCFSTSRYLFTNSICMHIHSIIVTALNFPKKYPN